MKVRLYLSLFLLTVSTSLFSNSVTQLDSFPELKIIEKHRIDTVTIFDYDTQEEKVTVVKNISEFVAIIDTTVTFDYNKYEETVTVRRDTISLYEYYKRYGSERCNAIEKYLKSLDLWKEGDLDTTHVIDAETYVETVSVAPDRDDCYSFCWGNYCFSADHLISKATLNELLKSTINVSGLMGKDECKKVESFSCKVIFIPVGQPSISAKVRTKMNDMSRRKILNYPMMSGSRILIEDIEVNGEPLWDAIVLRID